MTDKASRVSIALSLLAIVVSACSVYFTREAIKSSERMSLQSQRATMFSQFQEQYNAVSARFPRDVLAPNFRPQRGTDEYARLEAYWFFCFSEWYATNRVSRESVGDLWKSYYTPLIADALEIPSLRYVLEERIRRRGIGRGEWTHYLKDLEIIAQETGEPLSDDITKLLADVTPHRVDEVI